MSNRSNSLKPEDLMHLLRHSKIEKERLAELVKIAISVQDKGITIKKVFPAAFTDGIGVLSILDPNQLTSFIEVFKGNNRMRSLFIFPLGIPEPTEYVGKVILE